ncbi:MAG TPA: hypothetical protein V6D08_19575 [Candidatus Obscuribacterales bacterium]
MVGALDCVFFLVIGFAFVSLLWAQALNVLKPRLNIGRRVGPSYWGVYEGAPPIEDPSMRTFELKPPSDIPGAVGGSSKYSRGMPVKSARS